MAEGRVENLTPVRRAIEAAGRWRFPAAKRGQVRLLLDLVAESGLAAIPLDLGAAGADPVPLGVKMGSEAGQVVAT